MAGPRLPIEVVEARGKKNLTKAEAAARKESEPRNPNPVKTLRPPKWLPESQKKEFAQIAKELIALMPTLVSKLDADTIATYCIARQEWAAATNKVNAAIKMGDLEEAQGWSLVQDRCFKTARACATDLGMTITSRCRMVVPQATESKKTDFERLLEERRRA